MSRTIALSIKTVHLKSIVSGEKTIETRDSTEFYHSKFRTRPARLKLHNRHGLYVLIEVSRIDFIDEIFFESYEIHLGEIIHHNLGD